MKTEYIYQLTCDGIAFYIGRTVNLKTRLNQHLREAKTGTTKKCKHIRQLLDEGKEIEIEQLMECQAGELGSAEDDAISNFFCKPGQELMNSKGGDTGLMSPREQKELSKEIAYLKEKAKTRERIKKLTPDDLERCCDCKCVMFCKKQADRANEAYAKYEEGLLSLEDLKRMSNR